MKKYIVYKNINWELDCGGSICGVCMCNTYNDYMPALPIHVCSTAEEAEKCANDAFEKELKRLEEDGCDEHYEFVQSHAWTVMCIPKWIGDEEGDGYEAFDEETGEALPWVWLLTIDIMEIDI